jgi:hypothetical protein
MALLAFLRVRRSIFLVVKDFGMDIAAHRTKTVVITDFAVMDTGCSF